MICRSIPYNTPVCEVLSDSESLYPHHSVPNNHGVHHASHKGLERDGIHSNGSVSGNLINGLLICLI